jgi:hypothetical protein
MEAASFPFSLKRKDKAYSPTRTEFTEDGARPKTSLNKIKEYLWFSNTSCYCTKNYHNISKEPLRKSVNWHFKLQR